MKDIETMEAPRKTGVFRTAPVFPGVRGLELPVRVAGAGLPGRDHGGLHGQRAWGRCAAPMAKKEVSPIRM